MGGRRQYVRHEFLLEALSLLATELDPRVRIVFVCIVKSTSPLQVDVTCISRTKGDSAGASRRRQGCSHPSAVSTR
jgi:hypothetical protein